MKNLDIEKLERKNIYQLPDEVFEKMQANVLQKTLPVKRAKIIKLNWIYSAAAAIALLFGLTFFINNDPKETENAVIAQTVTNLENEDETSALPTNKVIVEKDENINNSKVASNNEVEKVEKREVRSIAVVEQKPAQTSKPVSSSRNQNAEIPMDQIIASFTSADLADVGRNTEQDVYLDLYN